jgi:hypothetical protein
VVDDISGERLTGNPGLNVAVVEGVGHAQDVGGDVLRVTVDASGP